jgi:iron complex transport system permease protein
VTPTQAAKASGSAPDTEPAELADADSRAEAAARAYRALTWRRRLVLLALLLATLAALVADVAVGGAGMRLGPLSRALFTPWAAPVVDTRIVWEIRMPMSLTGLLVGAALAVAGAQMQTILDNPLAEPYTLGVSAAAGFGAALSVVVGVTALPLGSVLGMAGTAWVFAMLACAVIVTFGLARGANPEAVILFGIALVFLFSALLSLMQYVANEAQLQQVVFWTLGSLGRASWPQIAVLASVLAMVMPLFARASWTLTALRLGDARAQALGVRVRRVRILTLVGVSLFAATAVALAGTIGFIGLVGPHVARILVGEDQRHFLPASLLSGSCLLVTASLAAKLLVTGVIVPVGIITSIVGVPVFVLLILTGRRRSWPSS